MLVATPALAGGVSWSFIVEDVQQSPARPEVTILLRPFEPGPQFPESCPMLAVTARFEREPFWRRTWSRELVTEASHAEAVEVLRQAAANRAPVRFGSMGTGLGPTGTGPCSMRSKGLALIEENGGTKAVFSFHDPI